jgi:low affinity Fe/Cu permease
MHTPRAIRVMNGGQKEGSGLREHFRKFAHSTSLFVGSPWTFTLACLVIIAWAVTGPIFHFSDTWQLVINTGTTIVTFLMVFLIQSTQNRDTRAVHLKLDELIRALKGARNALVNLEEMSDEELDKLQREFERVCGARKGKKEMQPRPPSSEPPSQPGSQ